MSWHYLPELAAGCSERDSSIGHPSVPWKKNRSAERCCSAGNGTACFPCSQSGTTYEHSMENRGVESWMSLLRASRVNHSAEPENERAKATNATCGLKLSESFAKYDRDAACWKTYQVCLDLSGESQNDQPILEPYLRTWPRAGIAFDGIVFHHSASEHPILGRGCGLWPTPTASGWGSQHHRNSLKIMVRRGVITEQRRREMVCNWSIGKIIPKFWQLLMGFPIDWTSLKPLGMHKFQQWLEQHGCS